MSDLPINVRFKNVTTLVGDEYIYLDSPGSAVAYRIPYDDFKTDILNGGVGDTTVYMLYGGENNPDEDVTQLIGGLNGISKNSNTINNG